MTSSASHSNPKKAPAFQFYVNEWRGSRSVQRMTWAQRGMYLEMLCEQWDKGALPDCPIACAAALGGTDEEWQSSWPILRRKFVDRRARPRAGAIEVPNPHDHDASRQIINLRLEQVRRVRKAFISAKKNAGREGGRAKAQKGKGLEASTPVAGPSTPVTDGVAKPSSYLVSSSSDLISSPSSSSSPQKTSTAGDPVVDALAADFIEQYPTLYAKCRKGASYYVSRLNQERDLEYARDLARGWPSLPRLLAMLEVFLLAKLGERNTPGSPGQFLRMAPDMDALLRQNGQ